MRGESEMGTINRGETRNVARIAVEVLCITVLLSACTETTSTTIVPIPNGGEFSHPSQRPRGTLCPPPELARAHDTRDRGMDLFMGSYHWGGYYDLTVEIWCMNGMYFSTRVFESVNGHEYEKIAPGRTEGGGRNDPGEC